jgi:hypothetical protein
MLIELIQAKIVHHLLSKHLIVSFQLVPLTLSTQYIFMSFCFFIQFISFQNLGYVSYTIKIMNWIFKFTFKI